MKNTRSRWITADNDPAHINRVMIETGLSRPIAAMLVNRGLHNRASINKLLDASWPDWGVHDRIPGLEKAVERLRSAVENKERILVYGDRDVDGVVSAVILFQTLKDLGANVDWYVPRDEGYGLNISVLAGYIDKVQVVVTVDCGISNFEEAQFLHKHGIDLIITDHHEPPGELPIAYACVDPKLPESSYPDREIAGCCVTLIVAQSLMLTYAKYFSDRMYFLAEHTNGWAGVLVKRFRITQQKVIVQDVRILHDAVCVVASDHIKKQLLQQLYAAKSTARVVVDQTPYTISPLVHAQHWIHAQVYGDARMRFHLDQMLPLSALGCLADMVPLHGLNRCVVQKGLKILPFTDKPGIQLLNTQCKISAHVRDGVIRARVISWKYIPLLNAAGRFGKADYAADLLLNNDYLAAHRLIKELSRINEERKELLLRNTEVFERLMPEQFNPKKDAMIVLIARSIPHGVSGIIANRFLNRFNRPVILMVQEKGMITGSFRSAEGFDVLPLLEQCRDLLVTCGGHKRAAGFTLLPEHVDAFKAHVLDRARGILPDEFMRPQFIVSAEIKIEDMGDDVLADLDRFEPYGHAWEYPIFCMRNVSIRNMQVTGTRYKYVSMIIEKDGRSHKAISWDLVNQVNEMHEHRSYDILLKLESEQRRGKLRLLVVDVKPVRVPGGTPLVVHTTRDNTVRS